MPSTPPSSPRDTPTRTVSKRASKTVGKKVGKALAKKTAEQTTRKKATKKTAGKAIRKTGKTAGGQLGAARTGSMAGKTDTSKSTTAPAATAPPPTLDTARAQTAHWYEAQDWTLFDFQRETWQAWHDGESGLVHSPTGSGKTLAAWLGPVQEAIGRPTRPQGLEVLWITPLRALANDTARSLQAALDAHGSDLRVDLRTGDTSSHRRKKQRSEPPFALVTTPESLSVMLTHAEARLAFTDVSTIVVDEWHELMSSKRGALLQLALARVRAMKPGLRMWGLSATLANLDQALQVLVGPGQLGRLVRGVVPRAIEIETVLPGAGSAVPWAGHLGRRNAQPVVEAILAAQTSLVFTNTRAQAELWFQALVDLRPDLAGDIALHHGSIDRELREEIEERLRRGTVRCVVCTSSLDLGVDFSPVEQVLQIGSPKGVARLVQRAGRSGHRPGAVSRVLCVPTHALELVEIHSVREALARNRIEAREPVVRALDVLCQHLVTVALGEGFDEVEMLAEVRLTHCFHQLTDAEWGWVMDFITRGGQALQGYPQYHKVMKVAGLWRVMNDQVAQRHRTSIGTIVGNNQLQVAFMGGKRLGSMPESFLTRLNPGDSFQFAGRHLALLRIKEMTAYVRVARQRSRSVPRWTGTQLPLSNALADTVLETLRDWQNGAAESRELQAAAGYLRLQQQRSLLPGPDDFLLEYTHTREGHSLFCYPFAGRLAHEGLSMLVAHRLSGLREITFTLQVNDYGFELLSPTPIPFDEATLRPAFSPDDLTGDILASMNAGELTQRRFRDIARIAGLIYEGLPGRSRSARQVQASSSLIYEVLRDYDHDNLLLDQARREVLEAQLEFRRIEQALARIATRRWTLNRNSRPTPLAFPLWAESVSTQTISSEAVQDRIERMLAEIDGPALQQEVP